MMDLLHGPVCPTTGSVLFRNVFLLVLWPGPFVLEPGPFCPKTCSVLSCNVVRFVWSVLSMVRFVQVPFQVSAQYYSDGYNPLFISVQSSTQIKLCKAAQIRLFYDLLTGYRCCSLERN